MVRKYDIVEFVEVDAPITEPVTKLGGQPVWLGEPQWPLGRELGRQMRFICQVALDPELLGVPSGKMAYLFMTGGGEGEYVDGTWEPEGGENAVIVQPSTRTAYGAKIEATPSATGPTLYRFARGIHGGTMVPVSCEYAVTLTPGEEPNPSDDAEQTAWSDEQFDAHCDSLAHNKIGCERCFVQGDEYPEGGSWKLFLQLEVMEVPVFVTFGDAGVGYAFVSGNGEKGRFLWPCH